MTPMTGYRHRLPMALPQRFLSITSSTQWLCDATFMRFAGLGNGTPHFGFAPAISITAWLVLTVYGISPHVSATPGSARARCWARRRSYSPSCSRGRHSTSRLRPGCRCIWRWAFWPPLCAFSACMVHAWLMTRAGRSRLAADTHGSVPLLTMERLVAAGFVLLSALLAGIFFSETLYGATVRGWKWDHKTVFSILAWLTFAVLLIGRARFGWRGRTARRVLYAGSALLLLAYVGSRFVLEVVLSRALVENTSSSSPWLSWPSGSGGEAVRKKCARARRHRKHLLPSARRKRWSVAPTAGCTCPPLTHQHLMDTAAQRAKSAGKTRDDTRSRWILGFAREFSSESTTLLRL